MSIQLSHSDRFGKICRLAGVKIVTKIYCKQTLIVKILKFNFHQALIIVV